MKRASVYLDPGHGGSLACAQNNGINEAEYAFDFATRLMHRLNYVRAPMDVYLTRHGHHHGPSHSERSDLTRGSDLVLSIHCNSGHETLHGMLTFHYPGNFDGYRLGNTITRSWPRSLMSSTGASVRTRPADHWTSRAHSVLASHAPTAVLLELGYLTNSRDVQALNDGAVKEQMFSACTVGIMEYLEKRGFQW